MKCWMAPGAVAFIAAGRYFLVLGCLTSSRKPGWDIALNSPQEMLRSSKVDVYPKNE